MVRKNSFMNKSRYIVIVSCSNRNIRASLLEPDRSRVIFCTDTSMGLYDGMTGMEKARSVAQIFTEACVARGVIAIALDRRSRSYSGRIRCFADSCREFGLSF